MQMNEKNYHLFDTTSSQTREIMFKYRIHLKYDFPVNWQLQFRNEWVATTGLSEGGMLQFAQMKTRFKRLWMLEFRFTFFDVPAYNDRIYVPEREGLWLNRFHFYYGRGYAASLLVNKK